MNILKLAVLAVVSVVLSGCARTKNDRVEFENFLLPGMTYTDTNGVPHVLTKADVKTVPKRADKTKGFAIGWPAVRLDPKCHDDRPPRYIVTGSGGGGGYGYSQSNFINPQGHARAVTHFAPSEAVPLGGLYREQPPRIYAPGEMMNMDGGPVGITLAPGAQQVFGGGGGGARFGY